MTYVTYPTHLTYPAYPTYVTDPTHLTRPSDPRDPLSSPYAKKGHHPRRTMTLNFPVCSWSHPFGDGINVARRTTIRIPTTIDERAGSGNMAGRITSLIALEVKLIIFTDQ